MTTNKACPVLNIILLDKIVHDRYIASMFKNFNQITKKGRVQHEETKYTIADYSSFLKLPSGSDRPAGAAKTPSQVGRWAGGTPQAGHAKVIRVTRSLVTTCHIVILAFRAHLSC